MIKKAIVLVLALAVACVAEATTYTVTQGGDSITGTNGLMGETGSLRYVINQINQAGPGNYDIDFSIDDPTIILAANLPILNLTQSNNLNINGYNDDNPIVIDGNNSWRAFFARQGTIFLLNLTIQNTQAQGGNGGDASTSGGGAGGGLGAGSAIYVYQASVILGNITLNHNAVAGGFGGSCNATVSAEGTGGGGMGGNGGPDGGGGGGLGGDGSSGQASGGGGGGGGIGPDAAGGSNSSLNGEAGGAIGASAAGSGGGGGGVGGADGGGGGAGDSSSGGGGGGAGGFGGGGSSGGLGGFGGGGGCTSIDSCGGGSPGGGGYAGGGGGASFAEAGGAGGFGGGGGGGYAVGGAGGFGAGGAGGGDASVGGVGGEAGGIGGDSVGANGGGGGGGAGLGGAIFVHADAGGALNVLGPLTIINSSVTAGIGGSGNIADTDGTAGAAAGASWFVMTGSTTDVAIGFLVGDDDSLVIEGSIGDDSVTTLPAGQSYVAGTGEGTGLVKQGGGSLELRGNNSYAGLTIVNYGTLIVNGSIAKEVVVNTSGTLKGTGSIGGGCTINGILSPGNSIGTESFDTLTLASTSTLDIEISPTASSSVEVTNAATIEGGTLVVSPQDSTAYVSGHQYTILTAASVSGTFSSVEVPDGWVFNVVYNPTSVVLVFLNAPFLEPNAPTHFQGKQFVQRFLTQSEYGNTLTWENTDTTHVAGYYLYRDGQLIATLAKNARRYKDHNLQKDRYYTYALVAFNSLGDETEPVTITIK